MAVFNARRYVSFPGVNLRAVSGAVRFETPTITPTTTTGERLLYVNASNQLIFDSGASTLNISTLAAGSSTLDSAYDGGRSITLDAGEVLFTVTTASNGLSINKTNTGAGIPLVLANAGTGIDVDVTNTNQGDATGIITQFHYDAGSPADDDIPLELRINADDDGGTETTLSTVRWYQRDVTAATDDAEFYMSLMVAGTERQVLQIDDDTMEIGNGNAAAVLSSSGAFDLTLETNRGTNSGTITITDGVNGNIQIAPDGTGVLDLNSGFDIDASSTETCTLTVVGTIGNGFAIDTSTITSGNVVSINHSVSGTLDGGNLLALLIDGVAYYSFGEVALTIAGTAGSTVMTTTAGDHVLSDGSLTITDADNAATVSMTNNTATTANTVLFTGSGVFTGTGTTAFFRVTQSGATSGDVVNVQCDGLTSGTAVRVGSTGTIVTTGALLELVGDSATTAAGLVRLTADALTTGFGVLVESTSVNLAAGQLLNLDHTASGAIVAKTGQLIDIVSSRNNTAAAAISDDYDALSIIRTNINTDAGGTLNAAGSVLRLENVGTQTAGTLADTVIGLEVVMTGGTTQDGVGISLTHTGTTAGRAMEFVLSHTSLDGVIQVTGNSVDSGRLIVADCNGLTTGIGLEVTHTTSVITTGSVVRITSTGVDTGTGQGTLLDLVSSGTTAAEVVSLVADALATGIGFFASFDGLTTGEGMSLTHTTSVIADGGSLFRLSSTGIDTGGATNGALLDLSSTAQAAGVVALLTANGLTTGTALRVTSSGTITSAGEGLVNIVGTGATTGFGLKIDLTEATLTTGLYINCYDDTGAESVFTVAENGVTTILGADGAAALTVSNGDFVLSDGAMASAVESVTCGVGAATFAVDSNVVRVTGDAGGNTITTITGGVAGQIVTLIFEDALVTINDDNTHGADSIDLVGANTTFADDATLTLVYAAGSWYEVSRSIND